MDAGAGKRRLMGNRSSARSPARLSTEKTLPRPAPWMAHPGHGCRHSVLPCDRDEPWSATRERCRSGSSGWHWARRCPRRDEARTSMRQDEPGAAAPAPRDRKQYRWSSTDAALRRPFRCETSLYSVTRLLPEAATSAGADAPARLTLFRSYRFDCLFSISYNRNTLHIKL